MSDEYKAKVLVVDDEAFVRMDLIDMLTAAVYQAREATCAAEAIEILEQDASIRVVFTDIQMPGTMDGLALSHYVRKRWPPTIIVISSGNAMPGQVDLPSDTDFLAKPFGSDEMGKILKSVELRLLPP